MLKQRVLTAVVLLAILLPTLLYPSPVPFCVAALLLIAVGAWEWGRLNGCGPVSSICLGFVCFGLCAASWTAGWLAKPLLLVWCAAGLVWVGGAGLLLSSGVSGWARLPQTIRLLVGVATLWCAWTAVAQARVLGMEFLLSVMLIVWVADIGAYFTGRAFGGRFGTGKLAPSISPGKSWEGVWGGMFGVLVLALAWTTFEPDGRTIFHRLQSQYGFIATTISLIFLSTMSVVGDLVESLVKRNAGMKDSSGLLPGHGGVLDRVDALLPVVPLAMMLVGI